MNGVFPSISALGAEGVILQPLPLPERRLFHSRGYLHLDGLWTARFSEALRDEARVRYRFAEIPDSGPRTPVVRSRLIRSSTPAATGELLTRLHVSLIGLVRALSGRLLVPTFSAYGYYENDDETLLHLDSAQCDLTLLTTALGEVGPLHLRPELRGATMDRLGLLEGDPTWDRAGGLPVVYPKLGVTALAGNKLPHNRPGRPIAELSAVAALCYRSLL